MVKRILLVEDDKSLRMTIENHLANTNDFEIVTAQSPDQAKEYLDTHTFDIILSDAKTEGDKQFELLDFVNKKKLGSPFILMTALGTVEQAVKSIRRGAHDFIVKPFALSDLDKMLSKALNDEKSSNKKIRKHYIGNQEKEKVVAKQEDTVVGKSDAGFITNNQKMLGLIENLKKVATSSATVLIQGESGTGKEVLSNMIHDFSPRNDKSFIAINCAALPDNLLESELFGHEKGSFTGAVQRQIGKFELSDGGTILLDEISEMSMNMQTKLLRVLQEREVYRIGGSKPVSLNLRVIAATNRDLYQYMKEGNFREDLYYRINVIPIFIPPLRERGEDVLILTNYFLENFSKIHNRPELALDELARYKITNYGWQGNVRELRNAMERAVLVGNFDQIVCEPQGGTPSMDHLSTTTDQINSNTGLDFYNMPDITLEEVEKRVIFEMLRRCDGNRTRTAQKLGVSLRTLRNKLKAYREEEERRLQD
jgi:two-component system, NtrC family, response regulator AtoC